MMDILRMFGGLALLVLMPIIYIVCILFMIVVARWIYMFIGVITGDKTVIDEFACHDKQSYWERIFGFQFRQDKRYPPPDDLYPPPRPRDWRRR